MAKWMLSEVHERLEPRHLIGCGAGGVVGGGREIEEGPGAVVWAASLPGGRDRHPCTSTAERDGDGFDCSDCRELRGRDAEDAAARR